MFRKFFEKFRICTEYVGENFDCSNNTKSFNNENSSIVIEELIKEKVFSKNDYFDLFHLPEEAAQEVKQKTNV